MTLKNKWLILLLGSMVTMPLIAGGDRVQWEPLTSDDVTNAVVGSPTDNQVIDYNADTGQLNWISPGALGVTITTGSPLGGDGSGGSPVILDASAAGSGEVPIADGAGGSAFGVLSAGEVSNVAAGAIVATDVQSAIDELDAEKGSATDVTALKAVPAWTSSASAILSAENNVGSLTDGLIKHTSGVPATATEGTDYYAPGGADVAIADGGTGQNTAGAALTALFNPQKIASGSLPYTVLAADAYLQIDGAGVINLPAASSARVLLIHSKAGTITPTRDGGDTIDGVASSPTLGIREAAWYITTGDGNWERS